MKTPDPTFNQWKEEMRQDALEKELKRIKQFSTRQSAIIQRQRRTLWFLSIFVGALFALLIFKGFLKWPHNQTPNTTLAQPVASPQDSVTRPAVTPDNPTTAANAPIEILRPGQDTLRIEIPSDGILFSVQIGAFTNFDLNRFNDNLVSIHQDTYEGINQLSLGIFKLYPDATEFLKIVKKIGFEDAFVMATRFGERIKIQKALMTRQKGSRLREEPSNKMSQLKE